MQAGRRAHTRPRARRGRRRGSCSGAMIVRRAGRPPRRGEAGRPSSGSISLAIPKSRSFDRPRGAPRDEDVAALHVAMDDPGRVRRVERRADRLEQLERLLRREPPLLPEEHVERHPVEVLHHIKWPAVRELAGVMNLDDPGVIEQPHHLDLAQEALHHLRRRGERPVEHLHRHARAGLEVNGLVHGPTSAPGDGRHNAVRTRPRAARQLASGKGPLLQRKCPRLVISCRQSIHRHNPPDATRGSPERGFSPRQTAGLALHAASPSGTVNPSLSLR